MNKAVIIGNLTNEPDMRATSSGISVCTFTVAVNRRVSRDTQGQKETDFIPIVTWRGLADNCFKYLHKGSKAAVTGSIQTRSYETQEGSKRYVTEVVADEVEFLSTAGNGTAAAARRPSSMARRSSIARLCSRSRRMNCLFN